MAGESNPRVRVRFGEALRAAREKAGISQAQLARKLGTSRGYIWQIEEGQKNLTLDRAERLASSIGLEIAFSFKPVRS